MNIEKGLVDHLLDAGYDVKCVRDSDPASSDERVIQLARREKRIVVTNDKDFGELTFIQRRLVAGIILLRIKGQKTADKARLLDKLLRDYSDKIRGRFVVVTRHKMRFVPMEDLS